MRRKLLIILGIMIVVLLAEGGWYFFLLKKSPKTSQQKGFSSSPFCDQLKTEMFANKYEVEYPITVNDRPVNWQELEQAVQEECSKTKTGDINEAKERVIIFLIEIRLTEEIIGEKGVKGPEAVENLQELLKQKKLEAEIILNLGKRK